MTKKSKTPKTAAALANEDYERRRLADLSFSDRLAVMKDRCTGLESTIRGSFIEPGQTLEGLLRIAVDNTAAMRLIAREFEIERHVRMLTEEHGK